MSLKSFTAAAFSALALSAALAPVAAQARAYNQSPFLPSMEQSKVNRVQAGISARASETGKNGVFERDCNDLGKEDEANNNSGISASNGQLRVGAFQQRQQRPKEQIIVARDIINVGGQCKVRQ